MTSLRIMRRPTARTAHHPGPGVAHPAIVSNDRSAAYADRGTVGSLPAVDFPATESDAIEVTEGRGTRG
ncbi:hypothetical protein, partial [Glycomyces tarimensis]